MSRAFLTAFLGLFLMASAQAQDLRALARLDMAASSITDSGDGVDITLTLSQAVPYRVYTLDAPMRLVLEFREVSFAPGLDRLDQTDAVLGLSSGRVAQGRSSLTLDLAAPMQVTVADLRRQAGGRATVRVVLEPVERATFAAQAEAPSSQTLATARFGLERDPQLIVALDPGHGGTDTGLASGALTEATVMLQLARDLKEALLRAGVDKVVLTRDTDRFVALPARIGVADVSEADLLLSLHAKRADAAHPGGVAVYTLSPQAAARATALSVQGHDGTQAPRSQDTLDDVAGVLIDIVRMETTPRAKRLAAQLSASLSVLPGEPAGQSALEGGSAILRAADIPSVLVELGLPDADSNIMTRDPEWRKAAVEAMTQAVTKWALDEAARAQ